MSLFFCLVLATQSGCLHAALNARHTGCCALEHQRTIDTRRHWRPGSLQVSSRSLLLRVQLVLNSVSSTYLGIHDNVVWLRSNNNSNSNGLEMRCQRSCRSRRRWRCLLWNRERIIRPRISWKYRGHNGTSMQCTERNSADAACYVHTLTHTHTHRDKHISYRSVTDS